MNRRSVLLAAALASLLHPVSPPLRAQELGVFTAFATSNNLEFPSPRGYGASGLIELAPSMLIRLSVQRLSDYTEKMGTVCLSYQPRIGCLPEMTETSITLTGLRAGLVWIVRSGERLRFGVGGGGSFSRVGVESTGVSGRLADFLSKNTGQVGAYGSLSASVAPSSGIPLKVTGGFSSHWVHFHTCSGEDPPQYDPLCKPGWFKEFEVGLSYFIARK